MAVNSSPTSAKSGNAFVVQYQDSDGILRTESRSHFTNKFPDYIKRNLGTIANKGLEVEVGTPIGYIGITGNHWFQDSAARVLEGLQLGNPHVHTSWRKNHDRRDDISNTKYEHDPRNAIGQVQIPSYVRKSMGVHPSVKATHQGGMAKLLRKGQKVRKEREKVMTKNTRWYKERQYQCSLLNKGSDKKKKTMQWNGNNWVCK